MAGATAGLLALLSGLLGGYQNGRKDLFAARADQADRDLRSRQIADQENQFGQSFGFQKERAAVGDQQWGQEFDFRKSTEAANQTDRKRAFDQGVKEHEDDFGLRKALLPLQTAGLRLGLLNSTTPILQGAVGTSPTNQQSTVAGLNAALEGSGVPAIPTPFAQDVDRSAIDSYVASGKPLIPFKDGPRFTRQQPGIEPTPETRAQMAQTDLTRANTDRLDAEAKGLPLKYQADYLRAKAEGNFKAMESVLQKYRIDSENANQNANRAVQQRGQDLSAKTAANGQAVTLFTTNQKTGFEKRKFAMGQVQNLANNRMKAQSDLRGLDAAIAAGIDPGTNTKLSEEQLQILRAKAEGLRSQVRDFNAQIHQVKEGSGIIRRDVPTGKFVKSTARTIQRKGGGTLTVQTVN